MQYNQDPERAGDDPSAGDPDILRDIVQQARGVPLDVQRITTQEIKALKVTSQKEASAGVGFTRAITGMFSGLFGAFVGLFAPPAKKRSQCDMYGHLRPTGRWHGTYPKCEECGAEITSDDQLRGSTAKR